jgi:protocatechuate 3,4-dioxygenase beta subunit
MSTLWLALAAPDVWADDQPTTPDAPGVISGTVTDGEGAPLPGIDALLYRVETDFPIRSQTTDDQGRYRFDTLTPGVYKLEFRDPTGRYGFQFYPQTIYRHEAAELIVVGQEITGIDVTLEPGGWLVGEFVTSATVPYEDRGAYLFRQFQPNVWESFSFQGNNYDWPAGDTFQFGGLAPGLYRFCLSVGFGVPSDRYYVVECYDNHAPKYRDGGLTADNATDILISSGVTRTIFMKVGDLEDRNQITGIITSQTGDPVAGALVVASRYECADDACAHLAVDTTRTDSYGHYTFPNLSRFPGPDRIGVWESTQGFAVPAFYTGSQTLAFTPTSFYSNVNITLQPGARITGTVRIANQGPPDRTEIGVYVSCTDGFYPLFSPAQHLFVDQQTGRYQVIGLYPGVYCIGASAYVGLRTQYHGYYDSNTLENAKEFVLQSGETRGNINFNFGTDDFQGGIAGSVSAGGEPAEGIKVEAFGGSPPPLVYTYTNSSGDYRFDGLLNGPYRLRFSDPDGVYATIFYTNHILFQEAAMLLIQGSSQLTGIDMALMPGGGITGVVRSGDGEPLAGVTVQLWIHSSAVGVGWTDLTLPNAVTDATGRYRIDGIVPGAYRVQFLNLPFSPIPLFYGQTHDLLAAPDVHVQAGQVTPNIDLVERNALFVPLIQD